MLCIRNNTQTPFWVVLPRVYFALYTAEVSELCGSLLTDVNNWYMINKLQKDGFLTHVP